MKLEFFLKLIGGGDFHHVMFDYFYDVQTIKTKESLRETAVEKPASTMKLKWGKDFEWSK